jgi:hypothetical protein
MLMINYTIGNRTCELPSCSGVPQRTAPPRRPASTCYRSSCLREEGSAAQVQPDEVLPSMGILRECVPLMSPPKKHVSPNCGDLLPVNERCH